MKKHSLITLFTFFVFTLSSYTQLLEKGTLAPNFTLEGVNKEKVTLHDLRGKVVLVDFWASWCIPCRKANKELPAIHDKYAVYNMEILSVSEDTNRVSWKKAIEKDQLNWKTHGIDLRGEMAKAYRVEGIPHAYLIDEEGKILNNNISSDFLEDDLAWYFKEKPRLYPKETHHLLKISNQAKYTIFDKSGGKVMKGKDVEIDISELADGDYTVEVNDTYNGDDIIYSFKKNSSGKAIAFTFSATDKSFTFPEKVNYQVYNEIGKLVTEGNGVALSLKNLTDLRAGTKNTIVVNGHLSTFEL